MKLIEIKIIVTDENGTKEQIVTLRELKDMLDDLAYQPRDEK